MQSDNGKGGHRLSVRLAFGLCAGALAAMIAVPTAHARGPGGHGRGGPPGDRGRRGARMGSGSAGLCDADAIRTALDSASSGDVVRVGACRVKGSFTVPHGVTLRGVHPFASTLVVSGDDAGVQLCAGEETTTLARLSVQSNARAAVVIGDEGSAAVKSVVIDARRGIGIGAEDVTSVVLDHVHVSGPVTRGTADSVHVPTVSPEGTGTHGVVLADVHDAILESVHVRDFALFGALLIDSTSRWSGGSAIGNVNSGATIWSGEAVLDEVTIARTRNGNHAPHESRSTGLGVAEGATVTTEDVRLFYNEGYGVFHSAAGVVEHTGLWAAKNEHAGVWYQDGEYLQLDDAVLLGNRFGGVVLLESEFASVSSTWIVGTTWGSPIADGIHAVNTDIGLKDLALVSNDRVGILSRVKGVAPCFRPAEHVRADNVRIMAGGGSLGAIFQTDFTTHEITEGIVRFGHTGANDEAFLADPVELDIASGVAPCFLPRAQTVASDGLAALLGEEDPPGDPIHF